MDGSAKAILIVDNDEIFRDEVAVRLRHAGYHVATATNGQEAMNLLQSGRAAGLILLDMMMPVMDGWRFLQEREQHPAFAAIAVVIMSGLSASSATWAGSLGAVGFLRKPLKPRRC